MKTIKTFEKFSKEDYEQTNESWRQVKAWLKLPQVLIEMLLQKIIKFVPRIGLRYDELAAKIDLGKGLSPYKIEDDLEKLTLNDIKNDNLRRTLKTTGIFDKWNVYYAHTVDPEQKYNIDDRGRDVIYITKDELKKGDTYYGERISEHYIDKKYLRSTRKLLKSKGAEKFSDLEPQMYIVVAAHSKEHEEMRKERDVRYEEKKKKALEKAVEKAIKNEDILGRSSSFAGEWNNNPIAYKVIDADRVDLMKKLIDGCFDAKELDDMVNDVINNEGWTSKYGYSDSNYLPQNIKSIEMAKLLVNYIDAPDNKWIDKIKNKEVKEFFKGINFDELKDQRLKAKKLERLNK